MLPKQRFASALVASAFLLVAGGPQALAAAPKAGARYDSPAASKQLVLMRVSQDLKSLKTWSFSSSLTKCSDGTRISMGGNYRNEKTVPVAPDGSFSGGIKPGKSVYLLGKGKRRAKGIARMTFKGQFVSRDTATGTYQASFKSGKVTCKTGTRKFQVDRGGSAARPLRNGFMASGRYRLAGAGLRFGNARAHVPTGQLQFKLRMPARCAQGGRYRFSRDLSFFTLGKRAISTNGTAPVTLKRLKGRERLIFRARFSNDGGTYRVRGAVKFTTKYKLANGRRFSCSTGLRKFNGRFVSGPPALTP